MARTYPLFLADSTTLSVVAWVGGFTALFAGLIAFAQNDLKRILGYLGLSLTLYFISVFIKTGSAAVNLFLNNIMLIGFIVIVWRLEKKEFMKLT